MTGYCYLDPATGAKKRIGSSNQDLFEAEALVFYKPFPLAKISLPSLMHYILETLSAADFVVLALATLAVTLIGLLSPKLNSLLFGQVLPSGQLRLLLALAVFTVCVSVSTLLLQVIKQMVTARVETKMGVAVQAATMMRVLSLPAAFFQDYSAGDLASRAAQVQTLCNMLVSAVLSTGLTSVFSLVYISQIFVYARAL